MSNTYVTELNCLLCGVGGETPGHQTPGFGTPGWSETPRTDRMGSETPGATPTPGSKRRSRWDETPASQRGVANTPVVGTSGVTPAGTAAMQMQTPTPGQLVSMTPEQMQAYRWEREIDERNRPLSDEELDTMFPKEGYKVTPALLYLQDIVPYSRHNRHTLRMLLLSLLGWGSVVQHAPTCNTAQCSSSSRRPSIFAVCISIKVALIVE